MMRKWLLSDNLELDKLTITWCIGNLKIWKRLLIHVESIL